MTSSLIGRKVVRRDDQAGDVGEIIELLGDGFVSILWFVDGGTVTTQEGLDGLTAFRS